MNFVTMISIVAVTSFASCNLAQLKRIISLVSFLNRQKQSGWVALIVEYFLSGDKTIG